LSLVFDFAVNGDLGRRFCLLPRSPLVSPPLSVKGGLFMSKPLIQVTDLAKEYGFHQIFRQISLLIREGETVAIVGPNWVGKSTLLKILAGQEQPTAGTITWFRDTVSVAYVPQDHHFADNLSVEQVLAAEKERLQAAPGSSAEAISRFGFSKREPKLRVTALIRG